MSTIKIKQKKAVKVRRKNTPADAVKLLHGLWANRPRTATDLRRARARLWGASHA